VGNVGDSRGYIWSAGEGLRGVTKDHSYVQMLIDAGDLKEEDAWGHPEGSIITAHIGDPKLRQKDVFLRLCRPGDKLLLCSDGVVDMLRDEQIAPYLQEENPALVCKYLVDASNAAGGFDNITVVCVDFK
jgi:protein phosphatase